MRQKEHLYATGSRGCIQETTPLRVLSQYLPG